MLLNLVKQFFSSIKRREKQNNNYLIAKQHCENGDHRSAIKSFREHLAQHPLDVAALNDLGCSLESIGDTRGAGQCFSQALIINDAYPPLVINHAKNLVETQRIDAAFPILQRLKTIDPDSPHIYAALGSIAHRIGNAKEGSEYDLLAWLAIFDDLRVANCYLFHLTYSQDDEKRVAAEHRFWAETLIKPQAPEENPEEKTGHRPENKKKKRIGYWSPDFRNHSVRFFFRPLLENHDRDSFEIFIYHDFPISDEHTEEIKKHCDNFISVFELPDTRLADLIISHDLDILVELAGHTSANRINMLQKKLAGLQITGLGYPPTTGLTSIDAKILDRHILTGDSSAYYAEEPIALAQSFWCFDPCEEIPHPAPPPCEKNGYITFGCVGNISKITEDALLSWKRIMERLPSSQLVIRSISFLDQAGLANMRAKISSIGFEMERVKLLGPAPTLEFFLSYNEIDVILDTFPFNGGTTSCFCTYMGVPIITLAGQSLISRMGLSIMNNLGLAEWVAHSWEEYTEKAVHFAQQNETLAKIRQNIRVTYRSTALGNGAQFARDFEDQCRNLLTKKIARSYQNEIQTLPLEEIIKRAYTVLRYGQFEAAERIVEYCLKEYPKSGIAHLLKTYRQTSAKKFIEAAEYLSDKLDQFYKTDLPVVLVNIIRFYICAGYPAKGIPYFESLKTCTPDNRNDIAQTKLTHAFFSIFTAPPTAIAEPQLDSNIKTIKILLISNDDNFFSTRKSHIERHCPAPSGVTVTFEQCPEAWRRTTYLHALSETHDATIILHENIVPSHPYFFFEICNALHNNDIVSFGGAKIWDRMDWERSPAENKTASTIIPSGEVEGMFEINISGSNPEKLVTGMTVLNGNFIAIRNQFFAEKNIDELLDREMEGGGSLLEQYFCHMAHVKHKAKLAVHQNLGLVLDWNREPNAPYASECRWIISEKLGLSPLASLVEDRASISLPISEPAQGARIIDLFFSRPDFFDKSN